MAQVKKLSVKTVCGGVDLKKLIDADNAGKTLDLMTVLGQGVQLKTGESSYGDWTALLGQFQCTNCETGEVFDGATLFLPEVALVPLQVALNQPEARGVEFAFKIGARYVKDNKGGVPYEYTFDTLLPPDANDPIQRIKSKLLALQGPAPTASPAPETAPAPAHIKSSKK